MRANRFKCRFRKGCTYFGRGESDYTYYFLSGRERKVCGVRGRDDPVECVCTRCTRRSVAPYSLKT